jgi:hypothetical protein
MGRLYQPLSEFAHLIQFKVQFPKGASKNRNFDSSSDGLARRDYSDRRLRAHVRMARPSAESASLQSAFRQHARNGSRSLGHESSRC